MNVLVCLDYLQIVFMKSKKARQLAGIIGRNS